MLSLLVILLIVFCVATIIGVVGWGLSLALQSPRETRHPALKRARESGILSVNEGRQMEALSDRNGLKEIKRIHALAAKEWERKWYEETGEVWGTVYTTDPDTYHRAVIEHHGGHIIRDARGERVLVYSLGRSGPPVVWGEDPYKPKAVDSSTPKVNLMLVEQTRRDRERVMIERALDTTSTQEVNDNWPTWNMQTF